MNLEERQLELSDIREMLEIALEDLECAECCEAQADFDANLDACLQRLAAIRDEIRALRYGR